MKSEPHDCEERGCKLETPEQIEAFKQQIRDCIIGYSYVEAPPGAQTPKPIGSLNQQLEFDFDAPKPDKKPRRKPRRRE